jgi:hypothetical protein
VSNKSNKVSEESKQDQMSVNDAILKKKDLEQKSEAHKALVFQLPELQITDQDKKNFLAALLEGKPYQESFSAAGGSLVVTFRGKTKFETDIINSQVFREIQDATIGSETEYFNTNNTFSLYFQMIKIQGSDVPKPIYPKALDDEDYVLRDMVSKSVIHEMPDLKFYILTGLLAQFNDKCLKISQEIMVNPDFLKPATAS